VNDKMSRAFASIGCLVVALASASRLPAGSTPVAVPEPLQFVEHTIARDLAGGYQALLADLNRDGRPDIIALASDLHELPWYENPGWQRHVLASSIDSPINAAAHDADGDGIPEIALAHGFDTVYAASPGIVSILTHQADVRAPWSMKEIDRLPTSHRLRFVDIEGEGRKVLVNFPLIGPRATAPEYRDHVPLVAYRPGAWKREPITGAEEGVVHGIFPVAWNGERGGKRSVRVYRIADALPDEWTRQALDEGGMAAAGCAVADLNADQRPDVVCIGTATANLKWYENRGQPLERPSPE